MYFLSFEHFREAVEDIVSAVGVTRDGEERGMPQWVVAFAKRAVICLVGRRLQIDKYFFHWLSLRIFGPPVSAFASREFGLGLDLPGFGLGLVLVLGAGCRRFEAAIGLKLWLWLR